MRFYTKRHLFYCGVDLHARSMYFCVLDDDGKSLLHRNFPARPGPFLKAIAPYREDVVVCAECMFSWYWVADLCSEQGIPFVLGHALYMKAIHGGLRCAHSRHRLGLNPVAVWSYPDSVDS